ncbi:hypothetical protein DPMN_042232 [Dreissena polymorpha]|uniref:Uncharacterized protein n=1 Tax=Dreissena polymorpha TaxID=45954 RepID=A0A9D4HWS9_DREPO|nr:hypothetical protein DPMN_042232 [Dreissena polymorpha]
MSTISHLKDRSFGIDIDIRKKPLKQDRPCARQNHQLMPDRTGEMNTNATKQDSTCVKDVFPDWFDKL